MRLATERPHGLRLTLTAMATGLDRDGGVRHLATVMILTRKNSGTVLTSASAPTLLYRPPLPHLLHRQSPPRLLSTPSSHRSGPPLPPPTSPRSLLLPLPAYLPGRTAIIQEAAVQMDCSVSSSISGTLSVAPPARPAVVGLATHPNLVCPRLFQAHPVL
jgi:hypothetical protein